MARFHKRVKKKWEVKRTSWLRYPTSAVPHDRKAGILTYSITGAFPDMKSSGGDCRQLFKELTAAGLSGIFTPFPFDDVRAVARSQPFRDANIRRILNSDIIYGAIL